MPRLYNSSEVIAVTRVSQRCLDHWAGLGLISPSNRRCKAGSKRRGRGSERLYCFDEILKIKIIAQLRGAGLSLQKIRKGLRSLRKRSERSEPQSEVLVTDGRRFERRRADGKFEDLLRGGQLVFAAVAVQQIEDGVRSAIIKLGVTDDEFTRRARQGRMSRGT